jgi:hypothetical protein
MNIKSNFSKRVANTYYEDGITYTGWQKKVVINKIIEGGSNNYD